MTLEGDDVQIRNHQSVCQYCDFLGDRNKKSENCNVPFREALGETSAETYIGGDNKFLTRFRKK